VVANKIKDFSERFGEASIQVNTGAVSHVRMFTGFTGSGTLGVPSGVPYGASPVRLLSLARGVTWGDNVKIFICVSASRLDVV
jgi:hypothetical protein